MKIEIEIPNDYYEIIKGVAESFGVTPSDFITDLLKRILVLPIQQASMMCSEWQGTMMKRVITSKKREAILTPADVAEFRMYLDRRDAKGFATKLVNMFAPGIKKHTSYNYKSLVAKLVEAYLRNNIPTDNLTGEELLKYVPEITLKRKTASKTLANLVVSVIKAVKEQQEG